MIIRVCPGWRGVHTEELILGFEDSRNDMVSHGICDSCSDAVLEAELNNVEDLEKSGS